MGRNRKAGKTNASVRFYEFQNPRDRYLRNEEWRDERHEELFFFINNIPSIRGIYWKVSKKGLNPFRHLLFLVF